MALFPDDFGLRRPPPSPPSFRKYFSLKSVTGKQLPLPKYRLERNIDPTNIARSLEPCEKLKKQKTSFEEKNRDLIHSQQQLSELCIFCCFIIFVTKKKTPSYWLREFFIALFFFCIAFFLLRSREQPPVLTRENPSNIRRTRPPSLRLARSWCLHGGVDVVQG